MQVTTKTCWVNASAAAEICHESCHPPAHLGYSSQEVCKSTAMFKIIFNSCFEICSPNMSEMLIAAGNYRKDLYGLIDPRLYKAGCSVYYIRYAVLLFKNQRLNQNGIFEFSTPFSTGMCRAEVTLLIRRELQCIIWVSTGRILLCFLS